MKVILINAGDLVKKGYSPSLGIGYIKSFLKKSFKNKISTLIVRENILSTILYEKPDLLGINAISCNYNDAVNFAHLLKKELNIPIVIGGIHITVCPQDFDPIFDYGVIGEGELVMKNLIQCLLNKDKSSCKKINGLIYKNKKNNIFFNKNIDALTDLNILPSIDRADFKDVATYNYILTSRGCPYNCLFCASDKIWKDKRIRYFSAETIYKEIKTLFKLNIREINISDDMFLSNKIRLQELLKLIKNDKNLYKNISFNITTKADLVTDEIGVLLKELNCKFIKTGLESVSEDLYQKLRSSDFKLFLRMNKILKKNKIDLILNLNLNNPWQDNSEYLRIYNFLSVNKIKKINIYLAEPYPGTYYWQYALKEKIINKDFNLAKLNIIGFKSIDDLFEGNIIPMSKLISNYDLIYWVKKINNLRKSKEISVLNKILLKINKISNFISIKVRYLYKKRDFPEVLRWSITNKCNLNCVMCLNKESRSINKSEDVSYLKIQSQLEEISKYKSRLILYGGEPTMNSELLLIIRSIFIHKINFVCYTNLVSQQINIDDLLFFGLKNYYVSLDHFDFKIHDKIRNKPGSFFQTMKKISHLSGLKKKYGIKLNITIATVIVKENYKDLSKIYDFIESIGLIDHWNLRHNIFFYKNKSFYKSSNDRYKIKQLNGQIINDDSFFNIEQIDVLKNELALIKKKAFIYNTKIDIKKDINKNLTKYYLENSFSKDNCGSFLEKNIKIIGYDVQIDCGYSLGNLKNEKSIKNLWQLNKNTEFQKFVKKEKIPQCFRCARMKYRF